MTTTSKSRTSQTSKGAPPARTTPMSEAISAAIREMVETPGSSVKMCHDQGKTAVYLSDDRKYIISEPPPGRGPITKEPFNPDSQP